LTTPGSVHLTRGWVSWGDDPGSLDVTDSNRIINLYLPRVVVGGSLNLPYLKAKLGGEYSPWLQVNLDQELTITPIIIPEERAFSSSQSTTNAWSVNGTLSLPIPFLEPELFVEYDHLNIVYDVLTATGEAEVESTIRTLSVKTTLIPRFLNLQGFYPTISVVWAKGWTENVIDGVPSDAADDKVSFQFGFSR
jgi:hypothetical protein